MKIIANDNFKAGVTLDHLRPYLRDEVSNVWRLWKAGIVRENYARADVPGVVIVFECAQSPGMLGRRCAGRETYLAADGREARGERNRGVFFSVLAFA